MLEREAVKDVRSVTRSNYITILTGKTRVEVVRFEDFHSLN